MGLLFVELLSWHGDGGGGPASPVLKCWWCRVDAASANAILSRDFRGLLSLPLPHCVPLLARVNISLGPNEDRYVMTGLHTVKDIYCSCFQQILGWRYKKAYEESEKYKEGKFILEKARMWKEAR
uniref:Protein yippee-like n=1 Tax=Oryza punctata TaxID=4537 RepID=A0A0E0M701_ORYPU